MINHRFTTIKQCARCGRTAAIASDSDLCNVCRREAMGDPEQQPGAMTIFVTLLATLALAAMFAAAYVLLP